MLNNFSYSWGQIRQDEFRIRQKDQLRNHKDSESLHSLSQSGHTSSSNVLKQLRKTFRYRDSETFVKLYKQYVQPHVQPH